MRKNLFGHIGLGLWVHSTNCSQFWCGIPWPM